MVTPHHILSQSRDHVFQTKAAADGAALLREQARLERETGQALLVGLSVTGTLRALIRWVVGRRRGTGALWGINASFHCERADGWANGWGCGYMWYRML